MTNKDLEQDEMIRRNAEHIRRNEAAIERQTACLEKIRDHYFPKKSVWRRSCGFFLKVVGAVTVYAGLMETADWYWNARQIEQMAEQCTTVARRLMFEENDAAGAMDFLAKAVELEGNKAKYRTMLAYVKGMAAVADFFEIGRPFTKDERARVDAILAEATFLQTASPDDPMPYVLTAQANVLLGEPVRAEQAIAHAVELAPDNVVVRCAGCAMRFFMKDLVRAREELSAAEKIKPDFPLVLHWKGMLAAVADHDFAAARAEFEKMSKVAPRLAIPYAMLGWTHLNGKSPDCAAARAAFTHALKVNPSMKNVLVMMGETYLRENNLVLARLWFDRALTCDPHFMKALHARAEVNGRLGDTSAAIADWTAALALDPFSSVLYRARAEAYVAAGRTQDAESDRRTADALDARTK